MKRNRNMKTLALLICVGALMAPRTAFASSFDPKEAVFSNIADKVVQTDMESIPLNKEERQAAEAFNKGLASALRANVDPDKITPESLHSKKNRFDAIIWDYCQKHYDAMSAAVHKAKGSGRLLDLNTQSPAYKELTRHYKINEKMDLTITPEAIYVDEFAEDTAAPALETTANPSWHYKKYAARRTYFYKTTVNGKTNSWNLYSVGTGGEIKYNQSKAVHSSGHYGYSRLESSAIPVTFKEIVKQNEQSGESGWHYKYYGHGRISGPIGGICISLKDQPLGCEILVDKNGTVTKNYWPKV